MKKEAAKIVFNIFKIIQLIVLIILWNTYSIKTAIIFGFGILLGNITGIIMGEYYD